MTASWIFSANDVIKNLGVIVAGLLVALMLSRLADWLSERIERFEWDLPDFKTEILRVRDVPEHFPSKLVTL